MRMCSLMLAAWLGMSSIAACSDNDDQIRAQVTILCNREGAPATNAAEQLARYGRRAIPTIEAAMHTATATGKKNLVMALRKIGDAEAIPLLAHMAQFETSPDVKREAEWTLKMWAADGKYPDRAAKARSALRAVQEAKGTEEAG